VIELIVTGVGLAWLCGTFVSTGDKAVKGTARAVTRSAKRVANNVAAKADTVLQPCASGRAPHKRHHDGTTYSDGQLAYVCRVCGTVIS
jgi:hypothetical protein